MQNVREARRNVTRGLEMEIVKASSELRREGLTGSQSSAAARFCSNINTSRYSATNICLINAFALV